MLNKSPQLSLGFLMKALKTPFSLKIIKAVDISVVYKKDYG